MAILTANRVRTRARLLDLFTDRHDVVRHFSEYLNEDPPRNKVLFFYGDGGNGKSLLLDFLQEHCCKRLQPEKWAHVRSTSREEFVQHIKGAQAADPIPSAFLDFAMPPQGDERPQEPFSALLMLRRKLMSYKSLHGFVWKFPIFDYALTWYLYKTNQLSDEKLKQLYPGDGLDLATELANLFFSISWLNVAKEAFKLINRHLSKPLSIRLQQRNIDEKELQLICRMDPERELMRELPRLFAEDCNMAMGLDKAPKRVVLFFDTHEAFWGQQRNLPEALFFQRDEWLRLLLGSLDLSRGIVAVVAGREPPQWDKTCNHPIPSEYMDIQLVGHLSKKDADLYLTNFGIEDPKMRESLSDYAQVLPGQVHPFYLSLCAETVLAAYQKGEVLSPEEFRQASEIMNKGKELVNRLLRYVDREVAFSISALSACRAFDREIYLELGRDLKFQATEPNFRLLTEFSFVWKQESEGEVRYRIHDLLRRIVLEMGGDDILQAHRTLEQIYRKKQENGDRFAVCEAIYHANQQDWKRGIEEWETLFKLALEKVEYLFCQALLNVRAELAIRESAELGSVSILEGNYYASIWLSEEALREYLEAIVSYDEALKRAPDHVFAHNNKGIAYRGLGELLAALSRHEDALGNYERAITSYDEALKRAPDNIGAYKNKGIGFRNLGKLQARLSRHEEALVSYQRAMTSFGEARRRAPHEVYIHENEKDTLQKIEEIKLFLPRT